MEYLRKIFSDSDLEYQLIADKLANEIIECSICYFNEFRDSETDPGEDALELANHAENIAVGEKVCERIAEGMPILIEYVNEKPSRMKFKSVQKEVDCLQVRINDLQARLTPSKIMEFVTACISDLNLIKDKLGGTDADYLGICDTVVNTAIGMCIDYIKTVSSGQNSFLTGKFITNTKPVFDIVGRLDMSPSTRDIYNQVRAKLFRQSPVSTRRHEPSSGCYIATMVYGSYNAPEVMVLRRFRDEVLLQSWIGQEIVKIYYKCSPSFVKKTKHMKTMHVILKSILNPFVNYLKCKDE